MDTYPFCLAIVSTLLDFRIYGDSKPKVCALKPAQLDPGNVPLPTGDPRWPKDPATGKPTTEAKARQQLRMAKQLAVATLGASASVASVCAASCDACDDAIASKGPRRTQCSAGGVGSA